MAEERWAHCSEWEKFAAIFCVFEGFKPVAACNVEATQNTCKHTSKPLSLTPDADWCGSGTDDNRSVFKDTLIASFCFGHFYYL